MGDIRDFVLEIKASWLLVSALAVMGLCLTSFIVGYLAAERDLLKRP